MDNEQLISYWKWLFKGSGGRPGLQRLLNRWLLLHIPVGVGLGLFVSLDLQSCANSVLIPLAGVLIGLSFAWAGNANALLQTEEIEKLSEYHKGGFVEYVFIYQTAILMILVTIVLWGLAGLGVYDKTWPTTYNQKTYFTVKTLLFTLCSFAIRECWQVVSGAHWMLRIRKEIKDHLNRDKD